MVFGLVAKMVEQIATGSTLVTDPTCKLFGSAIVQNNDSELIGGVLSCTSSLYAGCDNVQGFAATRNKDINSRDILGRLQIGHPWCMGFASKSQDSSGTHKKAGYF